MRPRSMPDSHANGWLRLALDLRVLPVAGFLRICTGSLTSCLTCTLFLFAAGVGSYYREQYAPENHLSTSSIALLPDAGT